MIRKIIFLLTTLSTLSSADAIRPLLQFGFSSGGNELVTVQHDYSSDYTIDAGDGFSIEAGMSIYNPIANFETQLLIGYKFDSDSADNGDITWSMIPISALAFITAQNWKFGGGLTYHINPSLEGDFNKKTRIRDDFDDAIGGIIQIQYQPIDMFAIGIRGTFIEYQLTNNPSQKANGNSLGIMATFKFGGNRSRYR
jgi:hypothetical protein